jgi:hypothetical protein
MGAKSCTPCSSPCPAGFDYEETCGFWFWEEDSFTCTPAATPAGATQVSVLDIKYTGCPCSTFGNCEGTVKRAAQCAPGDTELSVVEDCCGQMFGPCEARFGTHETRTCVREETPVIRLTDGARFCPDKFFPEWSTFDVCMWCDGETKIDENGAFLGCWLPYAVDSAGDCFAYDSDKVGWFDRGDFRRGGAESVLPKFDEDVDQRSAPVTYKQPATVHAGASVAVGAAACGLLAFGGLMAKKRRLRGHGGGEGVAMTGVGVGAV